MSDIDMDEWIELTEAQQDAILDREMAAYQRLLDAMTVPQHIAHCRRNELRQIRKNRHRLRQPHIREWPFIEAMFRDHIRKAQVRLLKLRIWRATGVYPGSTS